MSVILSAKVLSVIYTKAERIYSISQRVKVNKHQCQRLTQRVESIVTVLKKISKSDFDDNGMEHALKDLNNTLEQCLTLIEKQLTNTSLLEQYWDNTRQFIQLNEQLSQNSITLNLALNINLIFNRHQDSSDQQQDLMEISSKIDQLALTIEEQNNKLKNEFNQRFDSLRNHCQQRFSNEQRNHFLHVSKTDLQFEELIGQGGFADVYRGIWISQDHPIAIKVFHFTDLTFKTKQNILNEISIMYQIHYDHLLGILGACVEPNYYAIIIEYMSLGSLFDILQKKEQIFSWSDRWSIALQMTKGINYLHKMSIIHQDIKSLNILMDKTIHGYLVKVSDFGLAKMEEEIQRETKQMKCKKTILGTSRWTAPELFNLNPPSMASDIYSLGIIFWELATESIPYEGWNDEDIIRNITKGFREDIPLNVPERFALIISNAWNQKADKRPSCQQLIQDIKEGSTSTPNTQNTSNYISEPDDTINKRQNSTSSPITNTENAANQLNDNSQFVTARTIVNDELTLENLIDEYELHANIQLSERQLTDQDMNIVVDLAIITKQCRALFLYSNNITYQGVLILCDSLHGNITLEELYIFDNHLSDIGVRYLVQPLKFTNCTLQYLHLAKNSITDDGVEYLADMLQTNTTLTHLWLDNNEISNRGIKLLTNVLISDNRSLSALYLRGNTLINDLCVSDLIDMFENNNSLKSISISDCDLSESGKMRLKRAISSQRGLKLNI